MTGVGWEGGMEKGGGERSGAVRERVGDRVVFAVVGDGPAEAECRAGAPAGTIFTGKLTGRALSEAYASADLFAFPSITETFGNVTLEAMACGLPVVAARATGSESLVADTGRAEVVALNIGDAVLVEVHGSKRGQGCTQAVAGKVDGLGGI